MDTSKQEAELQGLLAEGRALQKTLAVSSPTFHPFLVFDD